MFRKRVLMQYRKNFIITYRLTDLLLKNDIEVEYFKEKIINILNIFNSEFILKKIDYFFKSKIKSPQKKISLTITEESIMHLFGIAYYSIDERTTPELFEQPSFAKEFFSDFKNNNLSLNKCWVESLTKVNDKIEVLQFISDIKTSKVRIGGGGKLRTISMTNTLRTSRTFLGLGLFHESENSIPRTCLNLKADTQAKNNLAFKNVYKCSKIIEYNRLPNGLWKQCKKQTFNLNNKKKKKKRQKPRH